MSDYISLDDLKAMSQDQLGSRWVRGLFPFDVAACANCVTQHKTWGCEQRGHEHFCEQATAVLTRTPVQRMRENLEAVYSLRLFFKDLYANNPPEMTQPVASVELADVRA